MEDYARLKEVIDQRERSGQPRLPPEPQLAELIGVSRGRLRTLLQRAENDGLIWRRVGKGTFAGEPSNNAATSVMSDISLDDLFDTRMLIEPQLAAQASLHAKPSDLALMNSCLADMARTIDFLDWKRLDAKLHRIIAHATHNPLLLRIFDTIRAPARGALELRLEQVYGFVPGPRAGADTEHNAIVRAIEAHDMSGAEAAMRIHIASVRNHLFGVQ